MDVNNNPSLGFLVGAVFALCLANFVLAVFDLFKNVFLQ